MFYNQYSQFWQDLVAWCEAEVTSKTDKVSAIDAAVGLRRPTADFYRWKRKATPAVHLESRAGRSSRASLARARRRGTASLARAGRARRASLA